MTDIVGGSLASSGELTALSDITDTSTLTMEQVRAFRNKVLLRIANLVSGVDYSESGEAGHSTSVSSTINSLKGVVAMLNEMLENDNVVDPGAISIIMAEWNNPYL